MGAKYVLEIWGNAAGADWPALLVQLQRAQVSLLFATVTAPSPSNTTTTTTRWRSHHDAAHFLNQASHKPSPENVESPLLRPCDSRPQPLEVAAPNLTIPQPQPGSMPRECTALCPGPGGPSLAARQRGCRDISPRRPRHRASHYVAPSPPPRLSERSAMCRLSRTVSARPTRKPPWAF